MPDESLTIEAREGVVAAQRVLTLHGALTLSTLFEFQDIVRKESTDMLFIDLTDVSYLDSAGLGVLINAYVSRQKRAKSLALVGVNDRVMTIMRLTKVDQFFQFYPTLAEAEARAAAS